MLIDQLKQRMFAAMKANKTIEKEILRTCIGEITRTGDDPTDERVVHALRKVIKGNEETLKLSADPGTTDSLRQEIAIMRDFLPKTPSADELVALLAPVADGIRAAKADGPATGVAMKFLKTSRERRRDRGSAQAARVGLRRIRPDRRARAAIGATERASARWPVTLYRGRSAAQGVSSRRGRFVRAGNPSARCVGFLR
jgi:uncharacterized protein YqeY